MKNTIWTIKVHWPINGDWNIELVSPHNRVMPLATTPNVITMINDVVLDNGHVEYFDPHYGHTVEYRVPGEMLLEATLELMQSELLKTKLAEVRDAAVGA